MRQGSIRTDVFQLATASMAALTVLSGPASAQTPDTPQQVPHDPDAAAPDNSTAAPSATEAEQRAAAAQSGALEEVVVTARKRTEKLQDVAASVSALSSGELNRRFDSDVRDFANASPNVVIDDTQQGPGGVAAVYIRGIGVADVEKSVDPAVGVVFDDVYIGQSSGSLFKAIDISRVEVLRGPQGTLFGRNATGGVINIARSRPTQELSGKARVTYGRFDTLKGEAVVSGGLTPAIAVKVSAAYEKSDGYFYNRTLDQDAQRSRFWAIGGQVLITPTDKFEVSLSYDHQKTEQDPSQLVAVNRDTDAFCVYYAQCSPSPGVPTSGDPYVSLGNGPLGHNARFELDLAIGKAKYDLTDSLSLIYILGHLRTDEGVTQDWDSSPFTLYHTDRPAKWRQTTHEVRVAQGAGGPLTYVLGGYLWDSNYTIDLKNYIGFLAPYPLVTSFQNVRQTNKSWAVFGEADYRVLPQLKLTLGARYTHDRKTSQVNDQGVFFYDTLQEANPLFSVPGSIFMPTPEKKSWSKFTPKASLSYDITPDKMIYVLYSRGYRGGGFNGRPSTIGAATIPYDPETLDNYEAGTKTEWLGRRLRVNASVFLMKYQEMQQDLDVPAPGTSTGRENRTINAASADLKGAELEVLARPVQGFTVHGNLGYLDAKYKKFFGDIYSTGTEVDASFLKIRRAPKWTWDLGATYEAPIGPGTFWATGEIHYIGPHEVTFLNNPNLRNDGQHLVDASLNYRWRNTTVSLFGKNLANEKGWTIGYDVQNVWSYAAPRPPRTWGIALTQSF
jgi:iron complex outermembrane receptor protein